MGEALMPRGGGGSSYKHGGFKGTGETFIAHDDFVGAKDVVVFVSGSSLPEGYGSLLPEGAVVGGHFTDTGWTDGYGNPCVTGVENGRIYGFTDVGNIVHNGRIDAMYSFSADLYYEYIAIY